MESIANTIGLISFQALKRQLEREEEQVNNTFGDCNLEQEQINKQAIFSGIDFENR